jgi:polar amino acid transport system substrate-binding protein
MQKSNQMGKHLRADVWICEEKNPLVSAEFFISAKSLPHAIYKCAFRAVLCSCTLFLLIIGGCGMPRDCAGTYERVQGDTLHVGISENPPWTSFDDSHADGIEVELIESFADQLNAEVVWTCDSESDLFELLERGELDVVIGGLRKSTPWKHRVSLTKPVQRSDGQEHVVAVRQGENRLLLELDRFMKDRGRHGDE